MWARSHDKLGFWEMVRVCSSIGGDRSGITLFLIALVVDSNPARSVLHACSIAQLLCHAYELVYRYLVAM